MHRAGEGAPFTGLKPAGRDLGPAIPAADDAIRDGSVEPLRRLLVDAVQQRLRDEFARVTAARTFAAVSAGRAYVRAYVEFIHVVERLYDSATQPAGGHVEDAGAR